ncbi:pyrroline-5-carboxylate reductase [Candidatus Vallotia cooleyia]|uniref:pyrroline-5-carboxylate reductase n=1 Tax=Candidatus Vallotiella adelgis TaxID=1177211 RepID=UPI001D007310|nr:pyrroline-5-carboxylate reductase [Candidatus Vallotia cooleyia]UDG82166.1 Pyrroline-5-carboxylate reductase [Candidatus Vallotia cooleyia]
MKIAFIGAGNMATALIGGLIKRGTPSSNLYAIDPSDKARAHLVRQYPVYTSKSTDALLIDCDAIIIAVKPQMMKDAVKSIVPWLHSQLIISIAAGIRAADISHWLNGYSRVIRTMPNTPALIGMGVTGLLALDSVDNAGRALAEWILRAVGEIIWCKDESKINAVTAIFGSGPAYVFYFIEALQCAARELGLDDKQTNTLALFTFTGAAQLAVQSGESATVLRKRVTSKGGTTAAAIESFEGDGISAAIVRGALAAYARAIQMGDIFGKQ